MMLQMLFAKIPSKNCFNTTKKKVDILLKLLYVYNFCMFRTYLLQFWSDDSMKSPLKLVP